MVLGMEAGQSMDQSIADASRSLKRTHPVLSAGTGAAVSGAEDQQQPGGSSFRAFSQRNKEPELRRLANLLIDSDRFGSSIGPALRSHTKYLRTRFRQQAQEKARKVGVKLHLFGFLPDLSFGVAGHAGAGLHDDVPTTENAAAITPRQPARLRG